MLRKFTLTLGFFLTLGFASACGLQAKATQPPLDPNAVFTQAAQTIIARVTQSAGETAVVQLTQMAQASPTPLPATPTPTVPAITQTAAPAPTQVPPSPTPIPPTPTPIPPPCDWAQFVDDVTVKDGTSFTPGTAFTKTWRLKNIGTCTWNSSYSLVFYSGDQMSGPNTVGLTGTVRPGESVDISVNLKSPDNSGDYLGKWMLRNAAGVLFGIGQDQKSQFWVKIKVTRLNEMVYDLAAVYCDAAWTSGNSTSVPCSQPDEGGTEGTFVSRDNNPKIETGVKEDETGLVVHPSPGVNGLISGRFPAFRVRSGDHFRTVIGCMYEFHDCNVTFLLQYSADGGAVQTLGSWAQQYDESIYKVDLDLSNLAGKNVAFILTVTNNGDSSDDRAFWLLPRVVR